MKIFRNITGGLLLFVMLFSLLNTYIETDIAGRCFEDSSRGDYVERFKTVEKLNEMATNSYEGIYDVSKQRMVLEITMILLFTTSFVLTIIIDVKSSRKLKKSNTKETI